MNDSKTEGVPYLGSIPGSPCDRAGLLKGDSILAINGKPVNSMAEAAIALTQRCNPLVLDLIRNGQYMEIKVALAQNPVTANPAAVVAQLQEANIFPKTEESNDHKDILFDGDQN